MPPSEAERREERSAKRAKQDAETEFAKNAETERAKQEVEEAKIFPLAGAVAFRAAESLRGESPSAFLLATAAGIEPESAAEHALYAWAAAGALLLGLLNLNQAPTRRTKNP